MKNIFKNFKLSNWKRLVILGITLTLTILTISLGSTFFVSKKGKLSVEYGGGAEYVVKIKPETKNDAKKESNKIASQVAQEIYERIDSLGIAGAQVHPEFSSDGAKVRVTYPGVATEKERKEIETLITTKPKLTLTDIYGNPLFDRSKNFNKSLIGTTRRNHNLKINESISPIESGSAKDFVSRVQVGIEESKTSEWTNATEYISKLPKSQNKMIAWLDLEGFISEMKTNWPEIWRAAGENPFAAAYVTTKKDGKDIIGLRKYTINASKHLISNANVASALRGSTFVIEGGNLGPSQTKELSRRINYGASKYSLDLEYSNYINATYGTSAFQKAIIAGLIVFIFIALFLIVNYGLLGALSTISIALYVFITLTLFTTMRGQYSPESIAALIIGIGMAVDANIITFERLKNEVYSGAPLKKGFKDANKKSMSTIIDANITTLIVAVVLFFFGTRNIIGLSVTLILSIILTLFVMLGFTRFTSTILIKTNYFENKKHLLGMKPKIDIKIQEKINKVDYIKKARWFNLISAFIFGGALITFIVIAAISKSFSGGFNLSQDFTGGSLVQVVIKEGETISSITSEQAKNIKNVLVGKGINANEIEFIKNPQGVITSIKYLGTQVFSDTNLWRAEINDISSSFNLIHSVTTNDVAKKLIINAMIASSIAIGGIIIYTLFRFKWTYSIAAIIAILHDAIMVISVFVIFRIEISPVFIAGVLSIVGYSINDTIVTFDRLRENVYNYEGKLDETKIKELANNSIKDTLKRSLLTSFTTIMAIIVLMSFGNATKMSFNIAMLVGLISGTYSSIFIATFVWTKLEIFRQKRILKSKETKYIKSQGPEEQIFIGVNDY